MLDVFQSVVSEFTFLYVFHLFSIYFQVTRPVYNRIGTRVGRLGQPTAHGASAPARSAPVGLEKADGRSGVTTLETHVTSNVCSLL